jgi:hypothetical protein
MFELVAQPWPLVTSRRPSDCLSRSLKQESWIALQASWEMSIEAVLEEGREGPELVGRQNST